MSNQARYLISVLLHLLDVISCFVGLNYFGGSTPSSALLFGAVFCGSSHVMGLTNPLCSPKSSTRIAAVVALCAVWFMFTAIWGSGGPLAWVATGTIMCTGRSLLSFCCRTQMKPIAIRGNGPKAQIIALAIQRQPYGTYRLAAFLSKSSPNKVLSTPCLPSPSSLPKNCRVIDPVDTPGLIDVFSMNADWNEGGWCLRAPEGPGEGVSAQVKRLFDITIALALLVPIALVIISTAFIVMLAGQKHPFYSQERLTRGGRRFSILKLRTMPINAEPNNTAIWPRRHDNRVTPTGRILRQFWLDELPQVWNVLIGDLSWVGPRPERPEFSQVFSQSIPKYTLRHQAKAGVTGLAQIRGFVGNTSLRKRLMCDLEYIRTWSPLLDLRILAGTVCQVFMRRRQPVFDFTPGEGNRIP